MGRWHRRCWIWGARSLSGSTHDAHPAGTTRSHVIDDSAALEFDVCMGSSYRAGEGRAGGGAECGLRGCPVGRAGRGGAGWIGSGRGGAGSLGSGWGGVVVHLLQKPSLSGGDPCALVRRCHRRRERGARVQPQIRTDPRDLLRHGAVEGASYASSHSVVCGCQWCRAAGGGPSSSAASMARLSARPDQNTPVVINGAKGRMHVPNQLAALVATSPGLRTGLTVELEQLDAQNDPRSL